MLTHGDLKTVYTMLHVSCITGFIPFDFSYNKVRMVMLLKPTKSKLKLGFNIAFTIHNFLYQLFHGIRLHEAYKEADYKKNMGDFVVNIFIFLIRCVGTWLCIVFMSDREGGSVLMNRQCQLNYVNGKCCLFKLSLKVLTLL